MRKKPSSFDRGTDKKKPYGKTEGRGPAREDRKPYKKTGEGDKPFRSSEDRPKRSFDNTKGDRKPFRADDDRPKRSFGKPDGERRPFNRDNEDRPKRSFDRDNGDRKPFRNSDERPKRSFNKDDGERKPFRSNDDRPKRSFDKDAGERKPFRGNDDRPKRTFDKDGGERKPFRSNDDRPKRSFDRDGGDRKPFRSNDERPKRSYGKDDGERKSFRSNDDRPKRSFDRDKEDRKPFRKDEDRPKRSFDKKDGDRRSSVRGGDDKPKRFGDKKEGKEEKDNRFSKRNIFHEEKPEREPEEYEKNFVTPKEFEKELEENPKFKVNKKGEEDTFDKPFPLGARKVSGPFRKKFKEEQEEIQKTGRKPRRKVAREEEEEVAADKEMTLNKYIAHSGESSRRDAAEMVKQGKVKVNGELVLDPGYRVQPGDLVTIAGKKLTPNKHMVYVLLNKPKGFITTTDDPEGRDTVMDLVANAGVDRLYPVGRLDRNTTGVLLLTNDGSLAQKLSHPSYEMKKVYQVTLNKNLTKADFEKIANGLELEDGKVTVDAIAFLEEKNEIGLEIHSGRNRIVRRIFESLGYEVEKLDRVMYAGLTKKNVPRGKWRFLNEKEIILLKHFKS